ncbi:MAG: hypothetical protein CL678_12710 [Bdellovibrionaceae bacterium]|nr:hypothetical protein [Pseudobdellovibrionaceae bacterium]|tara:strand:- start:474 stop:1151 length:678 start_codon:yes stop_codon:yes gene_type:complete
MKRFYFCFVFVFFVNTCDASICSRFFEGLKPLLVFGVAVAPVVSTGVWNYQDVLARSYQREHIGMGIHLDFEEIKKSFSLKEKEILDHPKDNQVEFLKILSTKLAGDYDYSEVGRLQWFPGSRLASSYFISNKNKKRGVCRHKALILHSILSLVDISSVLVESPGKKLNHVWVYLPELNIAADPTRGVVSSVNEQMEWVASEGYDSTFRKAEFYENRIFRQGLFR